MRRLNKSIPTAFFLLLAAFLLCGISFASDCATSGRGWGPNPDPVADPISDLAATPGPASATLRWTPPAGCTEITLYYKKTTTGALATVPGATITSAMNNYTVRNLEPGVVYVFFLDVVGGDNQGRSNEVNVTPLATDPTPTGVPTTTPGPTAIPSVTVTIAPSVSPSASGASGGGGCTIGVFSFSMILLAIPIFALSRRR